MKSVRIRHFRGCTFCVAGLLLAATGCNSLRGDREGEISFQRAWPPAPAKARIRYVKNITGPPDLGVHISWLGKVIDLIAGPDSAGDQFIKPFGLALDEDDNLCFTDIGSGRVYFFNKRKQILKQWSKIGGTPFVSPVAIAKKNNIIVVADTGLHRVVAFTEKGKMLFEIKEGIDWPSGLAFLGEMLVVADARQHSIKLFDAYGRFLTKFGARGEAKGAFNFPTHLAVDQKGSILVTDSMNFRVQVLDAVGELTGIIGGAGDSSGHFSRPKGVAVDTIGHVYVVDSLFDNIQIFDKSGRFLLHWGTTGSEPGEFWMPGGIAISSDNQIYVADTYNSRIQVFSYVGDK